MQFTHLLCFAKGPAEVARVGCQGPDDEVVDLGSTIPDVLERGPKPSLRKGACCGPGMFWKSGNLASHLCHGLAGWGWLQMVDVPKKDVATCTRGFAGQAQIYVALKWAQWVKFKASWIHRFL